MMKILYYLSFLIFLISCQENSTSDNEHTSLQEIIKSAETGDKKYENEIVKIKAHFKINHPIIECLADCSGNIPISSYKKENTFLFQDYNICNGKEYVFYDDEGAKIALSINPIYTIDNNYLQNNTNLTSLKDSVLDIELSTIIKYEKAHNFCESTTHPTVKIQLTNNQLINIFSQLENVNLVSR